MHIQQRGEWWEPVKIVRTTQHIILYVLLFICVKICVTYLILKLFKTC